MESIWCFHGICVTTAAMHLRFFDCTLDMDGRELRRAGDVVPLRPRVFGLLLLLTEQRHRAVSKGEIFERLWPKRVVSDATLLSCVKELRRAVGDTGDAQRVIQTLHGHGFRFVAPIEADDAVPEATLPPPPAAPPASIMPMDREYKQVSVLVCALVEAEALATRLGAEAMDEVMQRLLARAQSEVERYSGTVSECSGAGFVILFGATASLEDHGRRAVQAALQLLSTAPDESIRLKFGLDTGAVVVGPSMPADRSPHTPAGETALRARRLCSGAAPGELLASEKSFRLVEAEVAADSGVSVDGMSAHRIKSIRISRAGVPSRQVRERSRFVGREHELQLLRERLSRARAGTGHVVCISGEPGIGKSRLLDEFRALPTGATDTLCILVHCFPHHATTPYLPVVALLRHLGGFVETDTPEHTARKLDVMLGAAGIVALDARTLLLELLNVPVDDRVLAEIGPETRRARTFGYVTQLLMHRTTVEPCLVMVEDLHWIDATSEAFLAQLVTRIEALRMLLLVTSRPGYQPPWAGMSTATQLALPRLSAEDSARLVDSVPHSAQLPETSTSEVVKSAQGNPFFLEELTWTVSERGTTGSERTPIPSTIQAVLAARIDKLALPEKRLLQIASIIGSRFDENLLRVVSNYDTEAFEASTRVLQSREFIYQSAAAPASDFTFRHALTQDVAYQTLLTSVRTHYHQRIAEILERDFPEAAANQPEVLGLHWSSAGRHDRAFAYWRRAGQRATERSANLEAAEHLRRALDMNYRLEGTPERLRERLEVLLMLGAPLMAAYGFASARVEENYLAARELCERFGTPEQRFTVAWGLWLHNLHRGRIDRAKALSQEVLALTAQLKEPAYQLQAHHAGWTTEQTHGDLQTCLHHAQTGMRLYEPTKHHAQAYLYGMHDPGVCAHGTASLAAWYLGLPDTALEGAQRTLKLAQQLNHPYSELLAVMNLIWIHCLRGEPGDAREHARSAIRLCADHHFPNYLAYARFLHGWACVIEGSLRDGIEEMRAGLEEYRALGLERHAPQLLTILAECFTADGRLEEAQAAIEEADALLVDTAELRWKAEVHRAHGEVLLARAPEDSAAAESLLTQALTTARAQNARALELRAAMSLARMWIRAGRDTSAREVLQPITGTFHEGHATADFRNATALLESCGKG
jgi:predicted ATPase/DNA-binding winged helix-turn-helix (wHTH) protein